MEQTNASLQRGRLAEGFCEAVEAGSLSQGRPPHHRQQAAGPLCRRRLRPSPCGDRRRHAARLRGSAGGRTEGHSDRLPEPSCGLVQRPGRGVPPSDVG